MIAVLPPAFNPIPEGKWIFFRFSGEDRQTVPPARRGHRRGLWVLHKGQLYFLGVSGFFIC